MADLVKVDGSHPIYVNASAASPVRVTNLANPVYHDGTDIGVGSSASTTRQILSGGAARVLTQGRWFKAVSSDTRLAIESASITGQRSAGLFDGQVVINDRNCGSYPATAITGVSDHLNRFVVKATTTAVDLRVLYGNFTAFATNAQDISVEAWIETGVQTAFGATWSSSVDDALTTKCTFAGADSVTIKGGAASRIVASDPLPIKVSKGDYFAINTRVHVASTTYSIPIGRSGLSAYGDALASDATATGAAVDGTFYGAASSSPMYTPIAVIGSPMGSTPATFACLGDSIMNATADNRVGAPNGYQSYIERGIGGAGYAFINSAVGGKKMSDLAAGGSVPASQVYPVLSGVSHVVVGMGRNDLTAAVSLATLQADSLTVWSYAAAANCKVFQTTLTPRTTSTDLFATTANQSQHGSANNTVRVNYNNWLRDGAPILSGVAVAAASSAAGTLRMGDTGHPLSGIIEIADAVESARDSGVWKAAAWVGTGNIANSSTTVSNVATTSGSLAQYNQLISGSSGANIPTGRYSNTTGGISASRTITLNSAATGDATAATIVCASTDDGLHPQQVRHLDMADTVAAAIPQMLVA